MGRESHTEGVKRVTYRGCEESHKQKDGRESHTESGKEVTYRGWEGSHIQRVGRESHTERGRVTYREWEESNIQSVGRESHTEGGKRVTYHPLCVTLSHSLYVTLFPPSVCDSLPTLCM